MGLSVLQKWMVEGRGLGVNRTGVWRRRDMQGQNKSENIEMFPSTSCLTRSGRRTDRRTDRRTGVYQGVGGDDGRGERVGRRARSQ